MSLAGSLEQVAKLSYGIEPPLVWRRHRLPTVTSARGGVQTAQPRAVRWIDGGVAEWTSSLFVSWL